jgi:hypothetical protein
MSEHDRNALWGNRSATRRVYILSSISEFEEEL